VALAACGGGDNGPAKNASGGGSGNDATAIGKTIERHFTFADETDKCRSTIAPALLARIYGTRARCIQVERGNNDKTDRVQTTGIAVDGDSATARVAAFSKDGTARGTFTLAKVASGWRISGVDAPYLRQAVAAGLNGAAKDLGAPTVACVRQKLTALDDPAFQRFAYATIGERPAAQQQFVKIVQACSTTGGSGSLVRRKFEEAAGAGLRKQGLGTRADCVLRRLRTAITDDQILRAAEPAVRKAIERKTTQAITAC
jgi:hypothetical protein